MRESSSMTQNDRPPDGMNDLFAEVTPAGETEKLAEGAFLLRSFAAENAKFIIESRPECPGSASWFVVPINSETKNG